MMIEDALQQVKHDKIASVQQYPPRPFNYELCAPPTTTKRYFPDRFVVSNQYLLLLSLRSRHLI